MLLGHVGQTREVNTRTGGMYINPRDLIISISFGTWGGHEPIVG